MAWPGLAWQGRGIEARLGLARLGGAGRGGAGLSMARVGWVFSPCEGEGEPRGTTPSVAAVCLCLRADSAAPCAFECSTFLTAELVDDLFPLLLFQQLLEVSAVAIVESFQVAA